MFGLNAPLVGFSFRLLHRVQLVQEKRSVKFHWRIVVFAFFTRFQRGDPIVKFKFEFLRDLATRGRYYVQIVRRLIVIGLATGFKYQSCFSVLTSTSYYATTFVRREEPAVILFNSTGAERRHFEFARKRRITFLSLFLEREVLIHVKTAGHLPVVR